MADSAWGQQRENFERNRRDDFMAGRTDWSGKPTGGNANSGCMIIFLILTASTAIGSLILYKVI